MRRTLLFTEEAENHLYEIENNRSHQGLYSQTLKILSFLECDPHHPSLKTHEYSSLKTKNGNKIWEAYVQNNTPGAYRVFFHYGPDLFENEKHIPVITIIAITPHPERSNNSSLLDKNDR